MANDIKARVAYFYDQIVKDNNHRNKSWEHCYSHFTGDNANKDINLSCLHLSFYLASWGMYRGSSFLLWKDYLVHSQVVKILLQNTELQKLNFSSIEDAELKKVIELSKTIKGLYEDNINMINGKPKNVNATETLVSKIMLGTLGCIPAFDEYYKKGIKKSDLSYLRFNLYSLQGIVSYYIQYKSQFDEVQKEINKKSNVYYPIMKLIDMYFWEIGFEESKKEKS